MGWGDCGSDIKGRPIGYVFDALRDHPDCIKEIDRGLSYACGGMHGEYQVTDNIFSCEKYYCGEHLISFSDDDEGKDAESLALCLSCCQENEKVLRDEGLWQLTGKEDDPDYDVTYLDGEEK